MRCLSAGLPKRRSLDHTSHAREAGRSGSGHRSRRSDRGAGRKALGHGAFAREGSLARALMIGRQEATMAELLSDLRQAVRFALRNPGFTATAVLTLGLGIGASSSVFSVLNVLTLRPLGYVESRRVCLLQAWDEARNRSSFSMPAGAFVALAAESPSFERVAAYRYWSVALAGEGTPER